MNDSINQPYPTTYSSIDAETKASGFTMASDPLTGTLLRTLAASKPAGQFLELGTGTGLSASWILDGMDERSRLISIDNDEAFLWIAQRHLGNDKRLTFVLTDGAGWFAKNRAMRFDFIFADTWHGKYLLLDEALSMLNPGAFYIIDDMLAQPNWPDGHQEKVLKLVDDLERRSDLYLTKQHWATGIIIACKK